MVGNQLELLVSIHLYFTLCRCDARKWVSGKANVQTNSLKDSKYLIKLEMDLLGLEN